MNILIKLTSIVALIIAPHISEKHIEPTGKLEAEKTKTEIVAKVLVESSVLPRQ